MTVYVEKPAVNLREELASLRNQGGYEEQQFYFDGLVTNGGPTFSATTGWTATNGTLSVSSGYLRLTSAANGAANAAATLSGLTVGGVYYYEVVINADTQVTGNPGVQVGPNAVVAITTSPQTVSGYFTATSTSHTVNFKLGDAALAGETIDLTSASVFETDGTDVVHRMPKGWVPKDVFEDGLLQREGAANDYTVVYDGFDYYVKPAVAPSATTQTCVIGVRK